MLMWKKCLCLLVLLLTPVAACADDLKYLTHPQESLSAYLTIAERAQHSIELTTFLFEPCHSITQSLIEVFSRKAQQGVRVRLLLDANGHSNAEKEQLTDFFARRRIQVRFYNDYLFYHPGMNLRLHSKFLNVDSAVYISGSRNISDEYFGMSGKQNWVDGEVLVQGKSARQVTAHFNEMWNDAMTSTRSRAAFSGWKNFCGGSLPRRAPAPRDYVQEKGPALLMGIPERSCAHVSFVNDHPQFGNPMYSDGNIYDNPGDTYMTPARLRMKRTTSSILGFIAGTRHQLDMENWAYMPMGFLREAFAKLRERRVEVNLVTNRDMEDGPPLLRHAEEYMIAKIAGEDSMGSQRVRQVSSLGALRDGYELTPNAVFYLHAKTFVRDNKDVVVSSFNLDSRSYSTNLESAVMVRDCPEFAADVKKQIDAVNATFRADRASGRVPAKPDPDLFTKFFGLMNLTQF